MELAVARVAEELHRVTTSGPSTLRDVRYPSAANALWRWTAAQEDADVWAFVRAYTRIADSARVRSSLTLDDLYTIMTFGGFGRLLAYEFRLQRGNHGVAVVDVLGAAGLDGLDD